MNRKSVILILIGLLVASYPLMERAFAWYWQSRLIAEWEHPVPSAVVSSGAGGLDILEKIGIETTVPQEKENEKTPLTPQGEVIGVLRIDSIDVKLPIIKGLNETNLKIGVAFLEKTPLFGGNGNTVLAGHRGNAAGRLLNRLNEVQINDKILVTGKKHSYHYTVFNKVVVTPEDIEILRSKKNEKILTLVACEPIYKPTHRLIVQAKLEE